MSSLSENNNVIINNTSSTTTNNFTSKTSQSLSSITTSISSNNNTIDNANNNIKEIWRNSAFSKVGKTNDRELLESTKISWTDSKLTINLEETNCEPVCEEENKIPKENVEIENEPAQNVEESSDLDKGGTHHEEEPSAFNPARRPMNAFLIFCKKHRPIVRKRYPNLENRAVTRILGEWWAILEAKEKEPYTTLAKDYKDAFFTAYPNFKWYKLPAPPLRTQPIRPHKPESPPRSPPGRTGSSNRDFTPGKLADESQLGNLTSLLNTGNYSTTRNQSTNFDNNNVEIGTKNLNITPCAAYDLADSPPKPIKKRLLDNHQQEDVVEESQDGKKLSPRALFEEKDGNFSDDQDNGFGLDVRKSVRKSKGNRYAQLMANGKLLKKKPDLRKNASNPQTTLSNLSTTPNETPKLENTIYRLQERITQNNDTTGRKRTISEISDENSDEYAKAFPSFDLDGRIGILPSLSYETFLCKKKETKKRKLKGKCTSKLPVAGPPKFSVDAVAGGKETGSKKRKNKSNITRIDVTSNVFSDNNDLSGLATLAEIAASIEHQKID